MGLLDMFKDKAAELMQGAKDQVTDLTGASPTIEDVVGGATEQADQVTQTVDVAGQEGQNLVENVETDARDAVNKTIGE